MIKIARALIDNCDYFVNSDDRISISKLKKHLATVDILV